MRQEELALLVTGDDAQFIPCQFSGRMDLRFKAVFVQMAGQRNGIVMTGGGSLVDGFDKLITARTGIHTMVAEDAISCVAEGTGKSLDSLNSMTDGTVNLSRRRQMN